eukprot:364335-Chlamydomonas_euryale.AAC.6
MPTERPRPAQRGHAINIPNRLCTHAFPPHPHTVAYCGILPHPPSAPAYSCFSTAMPGPSANIPRTTAADDMPPAWQRTCAEGEQQVSRRQACGSPPRRCRAAPDEAPPPPASLHTTNV